MTNQIERAEMNRDVGHTGEAAPGPDRRSPAASAAGPASALGLFGLLASLACACVDNPLTKCGDGFCPSGLRCFEQASPPVCSRACPLALADLLIAPDGAQGDNLGWSIALDGDVAVVGAYRADLDGALDVGAAYVLERTGTNWVVGDRLDPSTPTEGQAFGWAVSIRGGVIAVGAPNADQGAGTVYVFERSGDTWQETARLVGEDTVAGDELGQDVATDGVQLAVSTKVKPCPDAEAPCGAVYVFERAGGAWSQIGEPVRGASDDLRFGHSVAIGGTTLAVGAVGDRQTDPGAVYVFDRAADAFALSARLEAPVSPGAQLGYAVAVAGDRVVAGAPYDDGFGAVSGAAFAFDRSGETWSAGTRLPVPEPRDETLLGRDVAAREDLIVIGAPWFDIPNGINAGAAFVFSAGEGGYQFEAVLTANNDPNDELGASVDTDGQTVVSGTYLNDLRASDSGGAYVWTPDCNLP